ncbi:MAG TPA: SRPBCC family protein, partial [Thermomicrobiales bacterium]|nr:SRPBCC family protein [Thermomicrobiales bacterium]
ASPRREERTDVISARVRIAAPPDVVFPYFTDPRLIVSWIGERAELDAHPGGVFAVDFGDVAARGTYLAVEPPHRVVFTWGIPGDATLPPGASTVEVVFVDDGGDTIVTLTHRDVPAEREPSHREGWERCLAALAAVIR